jgi:phosphoglycolate phosphatase-like HAD superfamily hydrolase
LYCRSEGIDLTDRLLLFDIDGTLVATGGAGRRAMNRAFHDVFGVAGAFDGVDLAGRTDTSIVADAFAHAGLPGGPAEVARFRERYVTCLQDEVPRPSDEKGVLPGISALLDALHPAPHRFLALLTGNYAEAAEVKLAHFDLWRYFRCGAFGDDHGDRNHLVPVALERARSRGLPPHVEAAHAIVIGDTPRDVACAHAHGARAVAVATGLYSAERLEEAGADVVFEDLSDTDAVLRAIGRL